MQKCIQLQISITDLWKFTTTVVILRFKEFFEKSFDLGYWGQHFSMGN